MFACVQQLWSDVPTGALAIVLIMVWDPKSPAEAGSTQEEQHTAPELEQMKVINHVRMHHIHSLTEHRPARTRTHTLSHSFENQAVHLHV